MTKVFNFLHINRVTLQFAKTAPEVTRHYKLTHWLTGLKTLPWSTLWDLSPLIHLIRVMRCDEDHWENFIKKTSDLLDIYQRHEETWHDQQKDDDPDKDKKCSKQKDKGEDKVERYFQIFPQCKTFDIMKLCGWLMQHWKGKVYNAINFGWLW